MRVMFDLETHGEEQLARSVARLKPGVSLVLAKSGLQLNCLAGASRRFGLALPPKITTKPQVNMDAFKGAATAAPELARVHKEVMAGLE